MSIVEITVKDLEYFINLVAESMAEFERIDMNFERLSTVCKIISNNIICFREIFCERES